MSFCENNIIDKSIVYKITGITRTKLATFRKAPSSTAKFFLSMNCGYIYPLLKTHKLSPEQYL